MFSIAIRRTKDKIEHVRISYAEEFVQFDIDIDAELAESPKHMIFEAKDGSYSIGSKDTGAFGFSYSPTQIKLFHSTPGYIRKEEFTIDSPDKHTMFSFLVVMSSWKNSWFR